jgi:hypothetical protein
VPLFRAALAHEHHYPPKWGTKKVLEFEDFRVFSTSAEQDEWEDKVEEYNTPVPDRIYCKHQLRASTANDGTVTSAGDCNTFMGSTTLQGGASSCSKCGGWSCRTCGGVYEVPEDTETDDDSMEIDHVCREEEPDVLEDPDLEDHYQRCPNPTCGFIVKLESACNAMDCHRCDTVFCYLCGEITTHEGDHFVRASGSRCPCYNRLGDANALFDDDPPVGRPDDDPIDPDDDVDPDPPAPDPHVFRDPFGPLQRAPNDPVLDAFRVVRDQIRAFDVEDNGQEARRPPTPDYTLERDLGVIIRDFEGELEETFGSVADASGPLKIFYRLLIQLDTNIMHIRAVENRDEIFIPKDPWYTERYDRAEEVRWHEALHDHLVTNFLPAFEDAIELAVAGSALLSFNPHSQEEELRMEEIFAAYLAWDMTRYRAGAVDIQIHHQRREALAQAELREYARGFARERAVRLREQEEEGQDVD